VWTEEALARAEQIREGKWTESVAVGSRDFVENVKSKFGIRAKGRKISGMDGESSLREPQVSYSSDFNA
jgi:putative transposase